MEEEEAIKVAQLGRNHDLGFVADKMRRIREPHVAPINALADEIADTYGLPRGHVPYVDPAQGGTNARVLVLLDNPSTKAEAGTGSGLLSLDNNDATAKNCRLAYKQFGVDWKHVVHWNVCPFPTANQSNGSSMASERQRGAEWTRAIFALCPRVDYVLLLGRAAEDGWRRAAIDSNNLKVTEDVPHCSRRGLSTSDSRSRFENAIRDLAAHLKA
nr:uracil-DNA glycosylase [Williamsia sp.]